MGRVTNENISVLLGKTLCNVEKVIDAYDNDEIRFTTGSGEVYKLYHSEECCESVHLDDIAGQLRDLVGSPITMAEEVSSKDVNPDGLDSKEAESFTWTFYKLATVRGYVTLRWFGESSGFYSERVDFGKVIEG